MVRSVLLVAAGAIASLAITDALAEPRANLGKVRPLAASKIPVLNGTTKIRRRSISGDRLRNDTLTGTQVNESRLGTVPNAAFAASAGTARTAGSADTAGSAQSAQSAASAGNASRLNGKEVVPLAFEAPPNTPATLIGQVGPLQIYAACASNGNATLAAASSAGGTLKYSAQGPAQSEHGGTSLSATPATFTLPTTGDRSPWAFTYVTGGRTIAGQFFIANNNGSLGCLVAGTMGG